MDRGAHGPQNEQVAARLRIVEEHVRLENEHNLAGIMATFADEAKYDDVPWAEQRLGRDAVEQYYRDLLAAFPDLHIDVRDRPRDRRRSGVGGVDQRHASGDLAGLAGHWTAGTVSPVRHLSVRGERQACR